MSQICTLAKISLNFNVTTLKSTPIVLLYFSLNTSSQYLVNNDVFPTPESPNKQILNIYLWSEE